MKKPCANKRINSQLTQSIEILDKFLTLANDTALSFNNNLCCHKSFILWLRRSQMHPLNEYNILHTNKKAA